jgi:hypothetical protein
MPRDEFPRTVKLTVAIRVGFRCSNPSCDLPTSGPHSDPERWLSLGEAAHISAASSGGPRYDASLDSAQRKDISNAIWLCSNCATLVDADGSRHSKEELLSWKAAAETNARIALEACRQPLHAQHVSPEALQILIAASAHGEIHRLTAAQLTYPVIRAGSCEFFSSDDPLLAAMYAEALDSLVTLGLASRHPLGVLYTLTVQGFKLGSAIAASIRPELKT